MLNLINNLTHCTSCVAFENLFDCCYNVFYRTYLKIMQYVKNIKPPVTTPPNSSMFTITYQMVFIWGSKEILNTKVCCLPHPASETHFIPTPSHVSWPVPLVLLGCSLTSVQWQWKSTQERAVWLQYNHATFHMKCTIDIATNIFQS